MKLKLSLFVVALALLGAVVALVSSAPIAEFVDLPQDVEQGIGLVLLAVVSWLFAKLISLIPWLAFLDQFRIPFAAAIALELINLIELNVPDAFGDVAILTIKLVLAILAIFIAFEQLRKRGFRLF